MNTLPKPNQRNLRSMRIAPAHRQKKVRPVTVLSPFLRHLNTGTLAFVLFVALAALNTSRGKEPGPGESAPAKSSTAEIVIDDFSFSPKTITATAGTTVTWTNDDSVAHAVVSTGNQFEKSPVLKPGQNFSRTFAATGTYSYFCSIHPRMTGKIIIK